MKTSLVASLLTLAALFCGTVGAVTANPDEQFLAAEEAYRSKDIKALDYYAQVLKDHPLTDYLRYWRLQLDLANVPAIEVRDFLKRDPQGVLAHRLRVDWLKHLAENKDWDSFDAENPASPSEDTELLCYQLQSKLRTPERASEALTAGKALWQTARSQPESCDAVFDALFTRGHLAQDEIWSRIRLALSAGSVGVARRANELLPNEAAFSDRQLSEARNAPIKFLRNKKLSLKTRAARELALVAVLQIAHRDTVEAAGYWTNLARHYSAEDQAYGWGQIAYRAAMDHQVSALSWYRKAAGDVLSDVQLGWNARAALRIGNWKDVVTAVDRMSAAEQEVGAWRYWKARALKSLNKGEDSRTLLTAIISDPRYYGQLARDELGIPLPKVNPTTDLTSAELQAAEQRAGLKRAVHLNRLGLNNDAVREWNWEIRNLSERELTAAAEFAAKSQWFERSIYTAERANLPANHPLRFPSPYKDLFDNSAKQQSMDVAWILGLVKQESRFIADARSSAGALGLMQLMPATARWAARKSGMADFDPYNIAHVDTNIALGTYYLRHVFEELGHPVLATAAYNAGPSRAARWRADTALEGAIYTETIPLNETRDYVRKVMLNATLYTEKLGGKPITLKERLGQIPGRSDKDRLIEQKADAAP